MNAYEEKPLDVKIRELNIPEEKKKELIEDVYILEERYTRDIKDYYELMVERDRLNAAIIELAKELAVVKEQNRDYRT